MRVSCQTLRVLPSTLLPWLTSILTSCWNINIYKSKSITTYDMRCHLTVCTWRNNSSQTGTCLPVLFSHLGGHDLHSHNPNHLLSVKPQFLTSSWNAFWTEANLSQKISYFNSLNSNPLIPSQTTAYIFYDKQIWIRWYLRMSQTSSLYTWGAMALFFVGEPRVFL